MVPIAGKPCIEHIIELLRQHGIEDIVVTMAYLPQAIRSYLGDGSELGVRLEYSVEDTPSAPRARSRRPRTSWTRRSS